VDGCVERQRWYGFIFSASFLQVADMPDRRGYRGLGLDENTYNECVSRVENQIIAWLRD